MKMTDRLLIVLMFACVVQILIAAQKMQVDKIKILSKRIDVLNARMELRDAKIDSLTKK